MLKSARLKKSWTAEFVSNQVGVSLKTYHRWESGAKTPGTASCRALCKIFEMTPEELGFIDHRKPKQKQRKAQDDEQLTEALALWSTGIASCWQLYMVGGQEELERLLPTYRAKLMKPALTPGQKDAASLLAQIYQLTALVELQHGDFVSAQTDATQALVYSQLSKDKNIYIASLLRLASVFIVHKRVGAALNAYNDALHCVNSNPDATSSLLQSWIFAGLAEIQGTMGREQEALQFLQLAVAVFPSHPDDDPCYSYAPWDRSILFLYEGIVFLRLGQPKLAWRAFAQIDEMRPTPPERTRAEFLKHKAYTSFILGNMIQSCIYLEAAAKAATEINSELAFSEIYTLYEHMLAQWGHEPRVRALAELFLKQL